MANMSDTLPSETWIARQIRAFFQSLWEKDISVRVVALAGSVATLMILFALIFFQQKMFFFGVASPFFFLTWLSLLFFFIRDICDIWIAGRWIRSGAATSRVFGLFFDLATRALIVLATIIVGLSLIYFVFVDRPTTAALGLRVSLWPVERQVSVSPILVPDASVGQAESPQK